MKESGDFGSIGRTALIVRLSAVVMVMILGTLAAYVFSGPREAADASRSDQARVSRDCILTQTFHYKKCGHSVTRRLDAPSQTLGLSLEETQKLYPHWSFQSFSSAEIAMSREMDLYCPDHYVLMPDEAGVLCIFQNRYGDALFFVSSLETSLNTLPEDKREEALAGIGFDSLEALESWLEAAES